MVEASIVEYPPVNNSSFGICIERTDSDFSLIGKIVSFCLLLTCLLVSSFCYYVLKRYLRDNSETPSEVVQNLKMLNYWIHWGYYYICSTWTVALMLRILVGPFNLIVAMTIVRLIQVIQKFTCIVQSIHALCRTAVCFEITGFLMNLHPKELERKVLWFTVTTSIILSAVATAADIVKAMLKIPTPTLAAVLWSTSFLIASFIRYWKGTFSIAKDIKRSIVFSMRRFAHRRLRTEVHPLIV